MRHYFVASTMFHILVAQAIAASRVREGHSCQLLLWGPRSRRDPIHTNWVQDYRRIILPQLWECVEYDVEGTGNYDIHALWPDSPLTSVRSSLRRMQTYERSLTRRIEQLGQASTVYVSNITAGSIDRHVVNAAQANGHEVHYIEDGVADGLSDVLKRAVDRSYWMDDSRPVQSMVRSAARRGLLYLGGVDRSAIDLGAVDYRSSCSFSAVYQLARLSSPAVQHQSGGAHRVELEAVRAIVRAVSERQPAVARGSTGSALYLSRPDSEDGLLSRQGEVTGVSAILAELQARHEGRVLVKPHPRDTVSKLREICERADVQLVSEDDQHLPAEIVLRRLAAPTCYGTWTGSLVYGGLLSSCHSISILPRLLALQSPGASARLAAVYAEFRAKFGSTLGWLENENNA